MRDLRNISEHWDEHGRSAKNLLETGHAKLFFKIQEKLAAMRGLEELSRFRTLAEEDPWAVFELPMPDNNEVWLSGIPLTQIEVWLIDVRQLLEQALRAASEHVPDMMTSHIDGDDATPLPEERRRYRLWREDLSPVPEWRWDLMGAGPVQRGSSGVAFRSLSNRRPPQLAASSMDRI